MTVAHTTLYAHFTEGHAIATHPKCMPSLDGYDEWVPEDSVLTAMISYNATVLDLLKIGTKHKLAVIQIIEEHANPWTLEIPNAPLHPDRPCFLLWLRGELDGEQFYSVFNNGFDERTFLMAFCSTGMRNAFFSGLPPFSTLPAAPKRLVVQFLD